MPREDRAIYAFVHLRYSGAEQSVVAAAANTVSRAGGTLLGGAIQSEMTVAFSTASDALAALDRLLRDGHRKKWPPSVGASLGEAETGCLDEAVAASRARELSWIAQPGQVLVARSAQDVVRQLLPAGMQLSSLGEVRLGGDIQVEAVCQLSLVGMPCDFGPLPGAGMVHSNISEPPPGFVGRAREVLALKRALQGARLVTLVAPGGFGKTMLARWTAYDLTDEFREGAWWIDLASIPEEGNVANAMVSDLHIPTPVGRSSREQLLFHLGSASALIVLDGCEHLRHQAAELVEDLLTHCPGITFIATSSKPLDVESERQLPLLPMGLPDELDTPDSAERADAVRLFYDRAAKAGVELTTLDLSAAIQICRLVDGIPLGIELAATRLDSMSVSELGEALLNSVEPLESEPPSRRKSLEETITWSYDWLQPAEQRLLRRLSLLEDEWTREMAVEIGTGRWMTRAAAEAAFDGLVRQCMVKGESAGRYRLLRPIRAFASSLLDVYDSRAVLTQKYTDMVRREVRRTREAAGSAELLWFSAVRRMYGHVRAALEHSISSEDPNAALGFCSELSRFWLRQGPYEEAYKVFTRAILQSKAKGTALGTALHQAGTLAGYAGAYAEAEGLLSKACEIFRAQGDAIGEAKAWTNLCIHLKNGGRKREALEAARRAVALMEGQPDLVVHARSVGNLVAELIEGGFVDEAESWVDFGDELVRLSKDLWTRAGLSFSKSMIALARGSTNEALRHLWASMDDYLRVGVAQGLLCVLERVGILAVRLGTYDLAARLLGGTAYHFDVIGVGRPPELLRLRDETLQEAGNALGEQELERCVRAGSRLSLDELCALARSL